MVTTATTTLPISSPSSLNNGNKAKERKVKGFRVICLFLGLTLFGFYDGWDGRSDDDDSITSTLSAIDKVRKVPPTKLQVDATESLQTTAAQSTTTTTTTTQAGAEVVVSSQINKEVENKEDAAVPRLSQVNPADDTWPGEAINPDNLWILQDGLRIAKQSKGLALDGSKFGLPAHQLCNGTEYDTFARDLHRYATNQTLHGPSWGRRQQRQPQQVHYHYASTSSSSSGSSRIMDNSTILMFGNSHVRQIAHAWIMQHADNDDDDDDVRIESFERILDEMAIRVNFTNGATLYAVTNSYVPRGPRWQLYLQELTGVALNDFDAIVVGFVNGCVSVDEFKERYPDLSCSHIEASPEDWIAAYHGPLLFIRPFYSRREPQAQQWARVVIRARPFRDAPLGFIDNRHHIVALGHEATNTNPTGDADCPTCGTEGHRCMGRWGGYPDLGAWDVAQWLRTGIDSTNHPYTPRPFIQNLNMHEEYRPYSELEKEAKEKDVTWMQKYASNLTALTETTDWMDDDDLHICRADVVYESTEIDWKTPLFQCKGGNYTIMSALIHLYAAEQQTKKSFGPSWGHKRGQPLPDGKKVLVVGDTHAKEIVYALLCQYSDQIVSFRQMDRLGGSEIIFTNGAKIFYLYNSIHFYSQDWPLLVGAQIGMSLASLDAIVVGESPECDGKSSFSKKMENLQANLPGIDCLQNPPPDITAWIFAFEGPLIFVNRFTPIGEIDFRAQQQIVQWSGRLNVVVLSTRLHITAVGHEGACVTLSEVSDAGEPRAYTGAHRCVGEWGGYPDLTAWDLLEGLDQIWGDR